MTKENYTHITFLLDRSGSMRDLTATTISGFNEFLKTNKEVPGKCTFTLHQFAEPGNARIEFDMADIASIPELNESNYQATGYSTALIDAFHNEMVRTGQQLAAMPEEDRPDKVIFVVLTDGEENSSRECKREDVKKLVEQQTNDYKWQFVFIGANIDAFGEAASYGVSMQNTMQWTANAKGTDALYCSMAANTRAYRAGVVADMAFSLEQREEQEEAAEEDKA